MISMAKAYLATLLAAVFGVLLLVQSARLHTAQLKQASTATALANAQALSAEALAVSTTVMRESEQTLVSGASVTQKKTNDQIRTLTAQRDALRKRVLNAERRAANPGVPQTAPASCPGAVAQRDDGAELLGSFGQEDVEEALRGDTIRLQLAACYQRYEQARQALMK